MQQNAYFRLSTNEDGSYLNIYPPSTDGKVLLVSEIRDYMKRFSIDLIAMEDLADELAAALIVQEAHSEIKLSEEVVNPIDEIAIALVSRDEMTAFLRFYPPSDGGEMLGRSDIMRVLDDACIIYGQIEDRIDDWLVDRTYCTDILIAQGIEPEESRDAVLEYLFETEDVFRPTIKEDGSVNFHELNLLNDVTQGDKLAVLTPEYHGKHGMNVLGKDLPSRVPIKLTLKPGTNTLLSEDGYELTAAVGGYVELDADKVVVHDTYRVVGNVGPATGDIDFEGIVRISGDVLTGYSVRASVDIFVMGVVEGATLVAERNIVIANGVHGKGRATITAGGDVTINFIQDCEVTAGGNVNADSVLFSEVTAKDSITVRSKWGLIASGELRAKVLIHAKNVGSALTGAQTLLAVGADPDDMATLRRLETTLAELRKEETRLTQSLNLLKRKTDMYEQLRPEHEKLLDILPSLLEKMADEITRTNITYERMKSVIERGVPGRVIVEDTIYEGSSVMISNTTYNVNEALAQCLFTKKGAEIVITSL